MARICTDERHDPDNPCVYDGCAACEDECDPPTGAVMMPEPEFIPWTPGSESYEAAVAREVNALRTCVRELRVMLPDGKMLPWMQHSPCDEAYRRAMAEGVA